MMFHVVFRPRSPRLAAKLLMLLPALLLPACHDGHMDILGYTSKPNYDTNIKTVRVNVGENHTFYKDLEVELQERFPPVRSGPTLADVDLTEEGLGRDTGGPAGMNRRRSLLRPSCAYPGR